MAGSSIRPFALILLFAAGGIAANELKVEPRSIRLDQSALVTIEVEDSFASLSIPLKMTNLYVEEGPFESSQFEWVNGRSRRRKIVRYRVKAKGEGEATVGPIDLVDDQGRRLRLEQVVMKVAAEQESVTPGEMGELETLLRRSDWIAVVAEVDEGEVWAGQQIDVTWYLYANDVRAVRVLDGPAVSGFWSEDLAIGENDGETVQFGQKEIQRISVRRMALFPLRGGDLEIGHVEVAVQALESTNEIGGVFSILERRLIEVRRSSPPISIVARDLPGDYDAVGSLALECSPPVIPERGPVSLTATLEGRSNLRSAREPSWSTTPSGPFEVEDLGVSVVEREGQIFMRRRWRYLLFPREGGLFRIPALETSSFDTESGRRVELRCEARSVKAAAASPLRAATPRAEPPPGKPPDRAPDRLPIVAGLLALLVIAISLIWMRGRRRRPSRHLAELESLLGDPRALRSRVHQIVTTSGFDWDELLSSDDETGENARSLVSLLDVMEKEPWEIDSARGELRRRLIEFLKVFSLRSGDGGV